MHPHSGAGTRSVLDDIEKSITRVRRPEGAGGPHSWRRWTYTIVTALAPHVRHANDEVPGQVARVRGVPSVQPGEGPDEGVPGPQGRGSAFGFAGPARSAPRAASDLVHPVPEVELDQGRRVAGGER